MRELSEATGHSRSYLRSQLRKFDIAQEKKDAGLQPFGWESKDGRLQEIAKEQTVICEILSLQKSGLGVKAIASELNRRSIPSKTGGKWWPSSVRSVTKRAEQKLTA